ncbi:unnamed protein product (macronuclear) [Paramecium tetraurelia]|uniref:Uncharacterized protein n=1 Tax=Paramecium tetraurelia TaxID=5888 RepID=A0DSD3_PARTE|nr:uncharacterized protein GSPATT00019654001 [Paramecium tetraurelia]CAK85950.1 unnamed protein product [Paramecium tetraurelia]|eukprot:XP_001453347.1 hypothetical protein (macronuclear) [Paramecium tetraurelia strain d4-2]
MSRKFITQYPLAPPMNDISNLYKKIRIQEQLQFFDEIIKKGKFKRPVQKPKNIKLPITISSKTIQLQSERSLSIRSPRIIEQPKKQILPPISKQKASISGWEVNTSYDSYLYFQ